MVARQPKGTRTGGQFAPMTSAESPTVLTDVWGQPDEPLKNLDAAGLVLELQHRTAQWPAAERAALDVAVSDATALHRTQMRENRAGYPRTPYIEHPLRNAIRLHRMGFDDPNLTRAAVLHDVAEDCADQIAPVYRPHDTGLTDRDKRDTALAWMIVRHGRRVSTDVAAVSNPVPRSGVTRTRESKNRAYVEHLDDATCSTRALAIKWVDYVDNAGSLHHNDPSESRTNRATKYLLAVPVFRRHISGQATEIDTLSQPGTADGMLKRLSRIEDHLRTITATPGTTETSR